MKNEESELIKLTVVISGRSYPLNIKKEEEETVTKAVELINAKVVEYQALYDGKDKQDYLAMLLLNFGVEHINNIAKNNSYTSFVEDKISQLKKIIHSDFPNQ